VAHCIGVREKVSPETFGIRICDPVKSEVPMRKLSIGVSIIGISGILVTSCLCILESRTAKPR
jgi:hypothetical protein